MNKRIIGIVILLSTMLTSCGTASGNAEEYSVENTDVLEDNELKGKEIYWLGSSVTLGYGSGEESMADYIAKRDQCTSVKEAVSGTTLQDVPSKFLGFTIGESYIERMLSGDIFDVDDKVDAFVCQLSTNDAGDSSFKNLGEITERDIFDIDEFDKKTICGAIEYIIAYVKETWNCPIAFYTNPYYDNENYAKIVQTYEIIAEKWGIVTIDLYSNSLVNNISAEERDLYMKDDIHPYKAGYRDLWTPIFEKALKEMI